MIVVCIPTKRGLNTCLGTLGDHPKGVTIVFRAPAAKWKTIGKNHGQFGFNLVFVPVFPECIKISSAAAHGLVFQQIVLCVFGEGLVIVNLGIKTQYADFEIMIELHDTVGLAEKIPYHGIRDAAAHVDGNLYINCLILVQRGKKDTSIHVFAIGTHPGEVVSQKVLGGFLADLFDGVVTVDPHLHRISRLYEAIPLDTAISLSGAPVLAELIAQRRPGALLIGPDAESAQWIEAAAARAGFDYGVCTKERHGDTSVEIQLPPLSVVGRQVVLLDDVASSGRTLAVAARLLLQAGVQSVDVAVTHALFAGDALDVIKAAGVGEVWSTDCISHPSNAIAMAPYLAQAVAPWLTTR